MNNLDCSVALDRDKHLIKLQNDATVWMMNSSPYIDIDPSLTISVLFDMLDNTLLVGSVVFRDHEFFSRQHIRCNVFTHFRYRQAAWIKAHGKAENTAPELALHNISTMLAGGLLKIFLLRLM